MHLCNLAALEQAPTAVVGKGQVCGQVTQDPHGDPRSFPACTVQVLRTLGDLLAVMLKLLCAGCQGCKLVAGGTWLGQNRECATCTAGSVVGLVSPCPGCAVCDSHHKAEESESQQMLQVER